MFDLGRTLIATAERAPGAEALVQDDLRQSYADLAENAGRLAGGLAGLGLTPGDHVAVMLQNTWQMATLHWACQIAGLIVTPLNWRFSAEELEFCLQNADARAVVYQAESADAVTGAPSASAIFRIGVDLSNGSGDPSADFEELIAHSAEMAPAASADDWSLMLYTSGTTGNPKGVPRRHRAERAAAVAHVAQNLYGRGERTLGVMPMYHTMGVRSLLAMALVDGCVICQPRFAPADAVRLMATERLTTLYLVPTLYHDIIHHPDFAGTDVSSVRKLGFAGMSMTDGLLKELVEAFRPNLFVNHYGSSEVYTFTICDDAPAKPGSAGKAGINQHIRVIALGSNDPGDIAPAGEEGQIAASLTSDEAFEGYWKRPDADEKAIHDGWYFTGDTGYVDPDGDLYVTGRVDDMIITGGENVFPVELESLLSLHDGVEEVAVAGLPDERWGQRVTAFVKRRGDVTEEDLDAYVRDADLANFKRPREFVFVSDIPKSPVGKILRRMLISGEYEAEG